MRPLSSLLIAALLLSTAACSSITSRTLPHAALRERATDTAEPEPSPQGRAVLAFANAQIGHPYCWGGTGPSCFDCSGLVQSAWRVAGIRLPRTSGDMRKALRDVPLGEVRPGDILWWPGHVAIYAGGGTEIEALDSRHGVLARRAADPYRALRPD